MKPAFHVVGHHNSMEIKAAIPLVHGFLFAETTVAAVFCWEYDVSRTHANNRIKHIKGG